MSLHADSRAGDGATSTSGRGEEGNGHGSAHLNRPPRYCAVVLDNAGEAAARAVRDCCVFIVPQARPLHPSKRNQVLWMRLQQWQAGTGGAGVTRHAGEPCGFR
jgi:hypothetical protein